MLGSLYLYQRMAQVIKKFQQGALLSVNDKQYKTDELVKSILDPNNLQKHKEYFGYSDKYYKQLVPIIQDLANGIKTGRYQITPDGKFIQGVDYKYNNDGNYNLNDKGKPIYDDDKGLAITATGYIQEILKQMAPLPNKKKININSLLNEIGIKQYKTEDAFREALTNSGDNQRKLIFDLLKQINIDENEYENSEGFNQGLQDWITKHENDKEISNDALLELNELGISGMGKILSEQANTSTDQSTTASTDQSTAQITTNTETSNDDEQQSQKTVSDLIHALDINYDDDIYNIDSSKYTSLGYTYDKKDAEILKKLATLLYNNDSRFSDKALSWLIDSAKTANMNGYVPGTLQLYNNKLRLLQYRGADDKMQFAFINPFKTTDPTVLTAAQEKFIDLFNKNNNTNFTIEDLQKELQRLSSVQSEKQGGILKAQTGTQINKDQMRKQHNDEKIMQSGFETEDYLRLTSLGQDVLALMSSFSPGAGTAAAGVLGTTSALTDLAADVVDEGVTAKQAAFNFGTNMGLAALGVMSGGKAISIGQKIAKWTPRVAALIGGTVAGSNFIAAAKKGSEEGFENLSREDWKHIYYGLKFAAGGLGAATRRIKNNQLAGKYTNVRETTTVTTKNGQSKPLTSEEIAHLKTLKTSEEVSTYLKQQGKVESSDDVRTPLLGSILGRVKKETTPYSLNTKQEVLLKDPILVENENNGKLPEEYIYYAKSQFGVDPTGAEYTAEWSLNPYTTARSLTTNRTINLGRSVQTLANERGVDAAKIKVRPVGNNNFAERIQNGEKLYMDQDGNIQLAKTGEASQLVNMDQQVLINGNPTTLRQLYINGNEVTIGDGQIRLPNGIEIVINKDLLPKDLPPHLQGPIRIPINPKSGEVVPNADIYLIRNGSEWSLAFEPEPGAIKLDKKFIQILDENGTPKSLEQLSINEGYSFDIIDNNTGITRIGNDPFSVWPFRRGIYMENEAPIQVPKSAIVQSPNVKLSKPIKPTEPVQQKPNQFGAPTNKSKSDDGPNLKIPRKILKQAEKVRRQKINTPSKPINKTSETFDKRFERSSASAALQKEIQQLELQKSKITAKGAAAAKRRKKINKQIFDKKVEFRKKYGQSPQFSIKPKIKQGEEIQEHALSQQIYQQMFGIPESQNGGQLLRIRKGLGGLKLDVPELTLPSDWDKEFREKYPDAFRSATRQLMLKSVDDLTEDFRKKWATQQTGGNDPQVITDTKYNFNWAYPINAARVLLENRANNKAVDILKKDQQPALETPIQKTAAPIRGEYQTLQLAQQVVGQTNHSIDTANARFNRGNALARFKEGLNALVKAANASSDTIQKYTNEAVKTQNENLIAAVTANNNNLAKTIASNLAKNQLEAQRILTNTGNVSRYFGDIADSITKNYALNRQSKIAFDRDAIEQKYTDDVDLLKNDYQTWVELEKDKYTGKPEDFGDYIRSKEEYLRYVNGLKNAQDKYKQDLRDLQQRMFSPNSIFYTTYQPYKSKPVYNTNYAKGGSLSYEARMSLKTIDNVNKNIRQAERLNAKHLNKDRKFGVSKSTQELIKIALGK